MTGRTYTFLRSHFLSGQNNAATRKLRLYISRAGAGSRRVCNETAVVEQLLPCGFQIIKPEQLSLAEQVRVFSSAEIVIAPHGGGLTNLVFCAPGTIVIEFFSPAYVNVCYWALSNLGQLRYYYLLGIGERPADYHDPHDTRADIIVDPDELMRLLHRTGLPATTITSSNR
jgi:capsular polysaccharide biosynthesis protein